MATEILTSKDYSFIPEGVSISIRLEATAGFWSCKHPSKRKVLSDLVYTNDRALVAKAAVNALLMAMPRNEAIVAAVQTKKCTFEQACDKYQPNQDELGMAFDTLVKTGWRG